ncbi:multiple monosaccharide ABC transporter substrate-binding protein [Sinanaerobacter chloroacetimidivorans]|uniref:Sugar-binding protein n=1 Tax=Sinanaerobacter chloroacetimidivorans TaxID=2818044 RepID=A0A8J8B0N1_9FIRM|nr:multiple monosaccharide ABC transporter substrate-binding protein [Sinanaerobacter chloroacetimidivorans]MBR0597788.1 sugar-binding protein [Sinanaerobacter chloroacetimidivorans]
MRKLIALLMVFALLLSMAACGGSSDNASSDSSDEAVMIGVSMPTQSLQRWNQDGSNMKAKLEEAGYKVDLQYAGDNDIPTQVSQIENMITEGCKVLVIAAIDGSSLTEVLKQAKEQDIPVIAYDRLIMNSDAVSYYATFDNFQVGVMQGQYIETALDLKNAKGPFNVELFTGDPADNNATFFFGGAMSILKPYIDSGVVVVPSGQTTQAQVSTQDWKTENAQSRMENLVTSNSYSPKGKKLDAVCCSNDSTAMGVVNALTSVGYTKDNMPIITGQDCDKPNVKSMVAGLQSMSVFKDTRTLADKVVGMVDSIVKGSEPEINDTKTYDNGTGVIPSYLCAPVICTVDNYKEILIDSGYYKEADIQ